MGTLLPRMRLGRLNVRSINNDDWTSRGRAAAAKAASSAASYAPPANSPLFYLGAILAFAITTATGLVLYRKVLRRRRFGRSTTGATSASSAFRPHNLASRHRRRSSSVASGRSCPSVNPDDSVFLTHFPGLYYIARIPGLPELPFARTVSILTDILVKAANTSPVLFYAVILLYAVVFIAFTVFTSLIMMHQLGSRAAMAQIVAAGTSSMLPFAYSLPQLPAAHVCQATSQWPGWANIKYAFVFGDSYSQTGFNYTSLSAPSPTNPMGNPPYPGFTSSNGPCWVDYLTTEYNASLLQTYNLAYGGATVDAALVEPYASTVLSIKDQVGIEFVPGYTQLLGNNNNNQGEAGDKDDTQPVGQPAPDAPNWHGDDSLFAIWIGINDVGNSYSRGVDETKLLNPQIMAELKNLVGTLYDAGGRNFVFLNVPPVDRSPLSASYGDAAQALEAADIAEFNRLLGEMAAGLQTEHGQDGATGVNVWVFDAHTPFGQVLDNPRAYPQTAHVQNTTGFCADYQNGTPTPDTLIESCGLPVNEFFWLNSLHPTYPMHAVIADQLSKALAAGPNVCTKEQRLRKSRTFF